MMQDTLKETTNGLGDYVAIANLTAVGAMVLIFVVLSLWVVTKGIPAIIERWDQANQRSEKAQAESQRMFMEALRLQADGRLEAAKSGHEAALKIAESIEELTREVRRTGGV